MGVGAVADGEPQPVLGDQVLGGGFVIDRQRGHLGADVGEAVQGVLEGAELGVAVRAPGPAVEQDNAEVADQVVGQVKSATAGPGHGERGELITRTQECCVCHVPLAPVCCAGLTSLRDCVLAIGPPGCERTHRALAVRGWHFKTKPTAPRPRIRSDETLRRRAGDLTVPKALVDPARLDAESAEWLQELAGTGARREAALARLHELLLRIARKEAARRGPRLAISGPELDDVAHQAAADALLAITAKIGQFRGESRFTTWAYKFVIFEVSAKIGRHFWRHPAVPLDAEDWDRLPARFGLDPAHQAEWRDLFAALRRAVDTELTPRQREVFVAIVLNDVPLDTLVLALASSRNAIYKMLFDARRKLRAALAANGYLPDDASRRS